MSGATGRVTYDNVLIHDTFVRNNGYGWSHQRPTKDGNFFYGGSGADDNNWNNYKFYNNKFMICYKYGILSRYMSKNNVGFVDNTYILAEGTTFARAGSNPEDGSGVITDYPYDAETLSRLRAYGVEEDGEFYSVPADYVPEPFDYKNANDIYTTGIYSDTNEHWAKGYVKEVTYAGLFNGVSADRFAPDGAMTRAMVYTVLARFDNSNIEGGEKWYDGAVKFAIDNGITTAELARPEDNVTRGELALMMYKYLRSKDIVVSAEKIDYKDSASFKAIDGASLDEVKAALDYCAAAGLIMGDDNGNMRFDANTKRSEVAAVFARMISFVRNAEVDIDAALAKGEYIKLDAEQLSKMMTAEWGKITLTEENGSSYIRVTPRTTKGTVALDLGQWNILDTDFTEYMYVKIKYRIHAGEKQLDINLYKSNIQQWLSTVDGSRPQTTSEDTWICGMFRFCDFTVNPSSTLTYDSDRLAYYKIKPFGNDAEIAEDATFDIDSIMFFKSEPLARAYEW